MIVLGLHFGHDAGVCVLKDGEIAAFALRERHDRIKHAMGLNARLIQAALADAGVSLREVAFVALTSTQKTEIIFRDRDRFAISFAAHPRHDAPAPLADVLKQAGKAPRDLLEGRILDILYGRAKRPDGTPDDPARHSCATYFPEYASVPEAELFTLPWMDTFLTAGPWHPPRGLAEIARLDASAFLIGDGLRHGFHFPVTVNIDGVALPGYMIHHHMAHAASAFYPSGLERAGILTHDRFSNGYSYHGGMLYLGDGQRILPTNPHHLVIGGIYEDTGVALGLGIVGAPGKLMGLAPYGMPAFLDPRFVGNQADLNGRGLKDPARDWFAHCVDKARALGYDLSCHRDRSRMTEPFNADVAASTQALFEETLVAAARAFAGHLAASGAPARDLVYAGGTALNCPANSRLAAETGFETVSIPPWCDDSGLSAGAALALYHNTLDRPRGAGPTTVLFHSPYQGTRASADGIEAMLAEFADTLVWEKPEAPWDAAAASLAEDRVIAWFEGRSEIGPRALGHRSLLADPRRADNWARLNGIKRRELWRPFAPSVLAEEAANWFSGAPLPSPYMLFTAAVTDPRVPAITHVDGSARLQTVDATCGGYYRLIRRFFELTGVPLVLNTSFNGPGEPIMETAREALVFLRDTGLDELYLEGWKVTRR